MILTGCQRKEVSKADLKALVKADLMEIENPKVPQEASNIKWYNISFRLEQ